MTIPRVYIINLDSMQSRYRRLSDRLRQQNVRVERVAAVDGADMASSEMRCVRSRWSTVLKGTSFTPGQIGCWRSHREAWLRIANGQDAYGVVMEDDVHVHDDFARSVEAALVHSDAFDVLQLFFFDKHGARVVPTRWIDGDRCITLLGEKNKGGQAYVLSREAAARMLTIRRMAFCNDDWQWYAALTGIRRRGLAPHIVSHDRAAPSAIASVDAACGHRSRKGRKRTALWVIHRWLTEPLLLGPTRRLLVRIRDVRLTPEIRLEQRHDRDVGHRIGDSAELSVS